MPQYPTLKPHGHRVLAEPLELPSNSPIVLPQSVRWNRQQDPGQMHFYRVVALGTGKTLPNGKRTQFECKPGDIVISRTHYGQDVAMGTRILKILDHHEIMGVLG